MKATIFIVRPDLTPKCCPGHDVFPHGTYSSNRSKRARSRDKKLSSKMARHIQKYQDKSLLNE